MIPVNSMTEEEINSVAEAFADYSYAPGERGLIYLFPEREALITYLKVMVRAGLKAGMVYTSSENREGFIIITDTTKPMPLGGYAGNVQRNDQSIGISWISKLYKALSIWRRQYRNEIP